MTNNPTACDRSTGPLPVPVLHNICMRPNANIRHKGRHACDLVRVSLGVFKCPHLDNVQAWCHLLNLHFEDEAQGLEQLRGALAKATAALAALPAIVSVVAPVKAVIRPGMSDNPEVALSVLCRSSEKVFIRDKSPLVSIANLQRDIALALPVDAKEMGT